MSKSTDKLIKRTSNDNQPGLLSQVWGRINLWVSNIVSVVLDSPKTVPVMTVATVSLSTLGSVYSFAKKSKLGAQIVMATSLASAVATSSLQFAHWYGRRQVNKTSEEFKLKEINFESQLQQKNIECEKLAKEKASLQASNQSYALLNSKLLIENGQIMQDKAILEEKDKTMIATLSAPQNPPSESSSSNVTIRRRPVNSEPSGNSSSFTH